MSKIMEVVGNKPAGEFPTRKRESGFWEMGHRKRKRVGGKKKVDKRDLTG
jgi:hypothetical protein